MDGPYPADCGISQATLDDLRRDFNYWYPFDVRVSGRDLVQNHLIMSIYNHVAIFGSVRASLLVCLLRAWRSWSFDHRASGRRASAPTAMFCVMQEDVQAGGNFRP